MILYYPMVLSNSISDNVVPGLMKMTERFVLTYKVNDVMETLASLKGSDINITRVTDQDGVITAKVGGAYGEGKEILRPQKVEKVVLEQKVDLTAMDPRAISIEPTYTVMVLEDGGKDGAKYSRLIGVKVLPLRARDDERLIHMLTYDRGVKGLQYHAIKAGRSVVRKLRNIWIKFRGKIPVIGKGREEMKGDVRTDILLQGSVYSAGGGTSNIFLVLNRADLDENFFKEAGGVRKLFKLGWSNLIVVDEVNRVAFFCFKQFRGNCPQVPFQMMYETLKQREAYESTEEIKRSTASIFKRRVTMSQAIGEKLSYAQAYIDARQTIQEIEMINEDLKSFLRRINLKDFANKMKQAVDAGNMKKLLKATEKMRLPSIPIERVEMAAKRIGGNYKVNKERAYKVLKNSLPEEASDRLLNIASTSLAVVSMKEDRNINDEIKKFVMKVRKSVSQPDKVKLPKEYILDAAIGWAVISLLVTVLVIVVGAVSGGVAYALTLDMKVLNDVVLASVLVALMVTTLTAIHQRDEGKDDEPE